MKKKNANSRDPEGAMPVAFATSRTALPLIHAHGGFRAVALCLMLGWPSAVFADTYFGTLDSGGRRGTNGNLTMDASLGGLGGLGALGAPVDTVKSGYIGQLYEVTNLLLTASPTTVVSGQASQLSGTAVLDDATYLALAGSNITWNSAAFPIASISPAGLAATGYVTSNTTAIASGSFLGVFGPVGFVVTPTNHAPVAPDINLTTPQGVALNYPITNLLAQASDPDGDQLTLTGITSPSVQGGSVSTNAVSITYTPSGGFYGSDSFAYTVNDGRGGTATANGLIYVSTSDLPTLNVLAISSIANGFHLRFSGKPGHTYAIQRSTDLVSWINLSSLLAPSNGIIALDDVQNLPQAYYRAALQQ